MQVIETYQGVNGLALPGAVGSCDNCSASDLWPDPASPADARTNQMQSSTSDKIPGSCGMVLYLDPNLPCTKEVNVQRLNASAARLCPPGSPRALE